MANRSSIEVAEFLDNQLETASLDLLRETRGGLDGRRGVGVSIAHVP